ncbi:MAG: hypothetical protein CL927_07630 [Deltaproteobacteria bacterium]|nr:hypothetical protein [Deltaproteobacteria bacterium]HCH65547.1 hypothetical protein [Deltaproteobacteria bacterium]
MFRERHGSAPAAWGAKAPRNEQQNPRNHMADQMVTPFWTRYREEGGQCGPVCTSYCADNADDLTGTASIRLSGVNEVAVSEQSRKSVSSPSRRSASTRRQGGGGGGGVGNAERAMRIAAQATSGGGGTLPHLDAIQQSFGPFDVTGVSAHIGGESGATAGEIGAEAYAFGDAVVFSSAPSLHLAAHEATHVIQQRSGNAPSSGLGQEGDQYETFADRVADAVVAGRDASSLLAQVASPGRTAVSRPAVQMRDLGDKEVSAKAMTRLNHARAGIKQTKAVLSHGAGNQKDALEATKFNSYFRMAAMRDPDCWYIEPSVYQLCRDHPEALTAAKADLAQGGNCGEHAAIAFDYLRTNTGETVHVSAKEGLDHAFVVVGETETDSDSDLVVCDPWPTAPTACLWEDHFAYTSNRDNLNLRSSATGDGRDIKAAIAAGLSLSPKGRQMVTHAFDEARTKEEIEKGTNSDEDNKPWIWQHRHAASRKYNYVQKPSVEVPDTTTTTDTPAPVIEEPEPVVDISTGPDTTQQEDTDHPAPTEGQRGFLGWIRDQLGL